MLLQVRLSKNNKQKMPLGQLTNGVCFFANPFLLGHDARIGFTMPSRITLLLVPVRGDKHRVYFFSNRNPGVSEQELYNDNLLIKSPFVSSQGLFILWPWIQYQ